MLTSNITSQKKVKINNNLTQQQRHQLLIGLGNSFKKRINQKFLNNWRFKIELQIRLKTNKINNFTLSKEENDDSFEYLFDRYEKEKVKRLLIVGEPGVGKTVLLLQFALKLVKKAKESADYPIPIMLNLATWRKENQDFKIWLEENLPYVNSEGGMSKKIAKKLIENNQLLLLLDGFDEIPENARSTFKKKLQIILVKLEKDITHN